MKYAQLINNLKTHGGDFFRNMSDDDMQRDFPWIFAQKGKLQPPQWHPEGDAFVHTCLVIDRCLELGGNSTELFCAMTHDLGKGITPDEELPHHYNHESTGLPLVHEMCDAFEVDQRVRSAAWRCCKYHLLIHRFDDLKTVKRVRLVSNLGEYYDCITFVSQCDAQGRGPDFVNKPYPQREMISRVILQIDNTRVPYYDKGRVLKTENFLTKVLDDAGLGKKKK